MNINDIRHKNFIALLAEYSSQIAFSNETGITTGRISHLVTKQRNIGEKSARKIESLAKKPNGWLDKPVGVQTYIVEEIIEQLNMINPSLHKAILALLIELPRKP